MSFEKRILQFVFDISPSGGAFANGATTNTITNVRATVEVSKAGGINMANCRGKLYGVELETMRPLTKLAAALPQVNATGLNKVTVSAGTLGNPASMQPVFSGTLFQAWADVQAGPDFPFSFFASEGSVQALLPAAPTTAKGPGDVATHMKTLADQMGYHFEDESGVAIQVSNLYLPGTLRDQAYALAQAANVNIFIENGVLAIWPKDGPRVAPGSPFIISPETGMIGYPSFTDVGVNVRTLFRPDILFGTQINITSIIQPACGPWTIYAVSHQLDCELPGGRWFTEIQSNFSDRPMAIAN